MNIVIIGGSFAGISCAMQTRRLHPKANIYIFEKQSTIGFIPSGLNLTLNDEIEDITQAYFATEKDVRRANIKLHLDSEVTSIQTLEQGITYYDHVNQMEKIMSYDKLILAMGSRQQSNILKDWSHPQIVTTKELQNAANGFALLDKAQHIVVVGGGQIGIEVTEALVNANKQVTLIEAGDSLLSRYFDQDFVDSIQESIEMVGVDIHLSEKVIDIGGSPIEIKTDLRTFHPDAVILGVNLTPQSQLVADVLALNDDGTIIVNDYLETSEKNIFAIGDLIQTPSFDDTSAFIALVNNAVRSGQIAAFNLFEQRIQHQRSYRLIGSRVFSQYITSVGQTEVEASLKHKIETTYVEAPFSITITEPVKLKLITERETGRILGAQIRSEQDILSMANTMALAIANDLTDQELAFQDRLYYPGITSTQPIIYLAALRSFEKRSLV